MLLRPDRGDLRVIGLNTGRVLLGVGLVMLLPAVAGVAWGELNEAAGFVIGACTAVLLGLLGEWRLWTRRPAGWHHGMVVAALSWLVAPFVGAIPLYLSGHYSDFLGAYFDAMSGFATAGLSVINDLDHVADSVNLWRHVMHFLGGQGLVLLVLSLFASGGGSVGMYVGEAREEKILPNVVRTARFIWRVSLFYFVVGTLATWVALLVAGMPLWRAGLHAVNLFLAAFDTGGFAPNSASLQIYHSATLEAVLSVLMIAGCFSFALHYRLWADGPRQLLPDVEIRSLTVTTLGLYLMLAVGLLRAGTYSSAEELVRRGLFNVVSAHTGTGFANMPGRLFVTDWGALAPAAIVACMALGAMAGSTAGGIKSIRVALVAKSIQEELRRLFLPPASVSVATYHSGRRQVLTMSVLRSALMILLLYLALYLVGALAGLYYGYEFSEAMFESTSAAAAVGLSIGITGPATEPGLKVVYILQMWIGRLEFVSVLALAGFAWSAVRGRT